MSENTRKMSLTVDLVVSYLEANKVRADDLAALIHSVHDTLNGIGRAPQPVAAEPAVKLTAAQIRKSITPERLISFEDGQGYTMLRRHLRARGLTPAEYRQKWGLPLDYPMTAPVYSETRSNLAKTLGLGRNLAAAPAKRRVAKPRG